MNKISPIEARAAEWISRRDRGALDEAAERQLDHWLAESPTHRVAYLRLNNAWGRADRLRALRPAAPTRPIKSLRTVPSPHRKPLPWLYGAAAAVALFCMAITVSGDSFGPSALQQFSTRVGARETVALADGSKLTLNTATQLRAAISTTARNVWLDDGEVYFDIAHDASRPFVVTAGDLQVTVLGTRFTLRREADRLQVNVLEGRVQLQVPGAPPTVLTRDESGLGTGKSVLVTRRTPRQSVVVTSWLEGRLVFDQTALADAAAQFNRYNQKKLVITDGVASSIRIGGTFEATNVEAFVRLIQSGFGLDVQVRDDQFLVASQRKAAS